MKDDVSGGDSAFGFGGSWREYAPIAFTNLLLTIVTLGVYSFWARARTRRYLWSRTRFIDDRLEWTGTGTELFVGYLIAIVCFFLPLGAVQLMLQGVVMRGHQGLAGLIAVGIYLLLLYLVGVARFRALRYRLSRTFWHGIRGGSDEQGFAFAGQYLWRTLVGYAAAGLLVPWSMAKLWNRRWNAMSFGPLRFEAAAQWRSVFGRFMLFYLAPIAFLIVVVLLIALIGFGSIAMGGGAPSSRTGMLMLFVLTAIGGYLFFFVVLGIVALVFYSAFFRAAIGTLRLGDLSFGFTARTRDWVLLYLGNIGLTVATLGIGYIFVAYRNWAFFVRHAQAYGELTLDELTQSRTREPGQGEGLLDAFDVGAF